MSRSSVFGAIFLAGGASQCLAITVVSSAQSGPNAAAMVGTLVDAGSFYTVVVGSESTTINAAGNPTSNLRAMGSFSNGVTAAGTLLPAANQNMTGDAQYAGGIDVNSGICLCTGLITDSDPLVTGVPAGFGVGVEGPNNGQPIASEGVAGELDAELGKPLDADFTSVIPPVGPDDGDATVLRFKITLSKPGILRINFVHASDEFPRFSLDTYNDTPLVLIGDANGQNMKNFILFRDSSGMDKTLSLDDLNNCGLLQGNLVAPSPASLPVSPHANVGTTLHFNHEFGGFTKKLTRETCDIYPPGVYAIKLVIQDVGDDNLDSATFFEGASLKLYHFLPADFDLDATSTAPTS